MALQRYFVIRREGDTTMVSSMYRDELLEQLNENHFGNAGFLDRVIDPDVAYWGSNILIIKGEVVEPQPVEIVRKYDV